MVTMDLIVLLIELEAHDSIPHNETPVVRGVVNGSNGSGVVDTTDVGRLVGVLPSVPTFWIGVDEVYEAQIR